MRLTTAIATIATGIGIGAASAQVSLPPLEIYGPQPGDRFGFTPAVSGRLAVFGAVYAESYQGEAYPIDLSDPISPFQFEVLQPTDHRGLPQFGVANAISGDIIVVGAFGDWGPPDQSASAAGAAYVFKRNVNGTPDDLTDDTWVLMERIFDGTPVEADYFGNNVAVDGEWVAVAAHEAAPRLPGNVGAGEVWLFNISDPVASIRLPAIVGHDTVAGDSFGRSVDISGEFLVVGADRHANYTGAVYVFRHDDNGTPLLPADDLWYEVAKLTAFDGMPGDRFGFSVAIDGGTVVVGAWLNGALGTDAGAAYLFQHDDNGTPDDPDDDSWIPGAPLVAAETQAGDEFGGSVSICGGIAAVGARGVAGRTGAAYIFDVRDPAAPAQLLGEITAADGAPGDEFGWVAVGDGIVVIGAPYTNGLQGSAYVLERPILNEPPYCMADLSDAEARFFQPSPGVFVVTEGETIVVPFTGDDPDGDDLMAVLLGLPGSELSVLSGPSPLETTVTWTPDASDKAAAPYFPEIEFTDGLDTSGCGFEIADINLRPSCSAGADIEIEATDYAGAAVTLYGFATDEDDDDLTLVYEWDVSDPNVILDDPGSPTPTGTFPIGITQAVLTVTDGRGGVCVDDVQITVQDTTPPEVMCVTDLTALWPPNHQMRDVAVTVTATDACADPDFIFPLTITVSSDEPDDATGLGDGQTTGDVDGHDGFSAPVDVYGRMMWDPDEKAYIGTIPLRAERDGNGDGRCYTIHVIAIDSQGNVAETSCCVVVPNDRRRNGGG